MIYSLLILTFGVFLGQEFDLPLVKNSALYIYNLIQESKKIQVNQEIQKSILQSFFSYFYMT
jgi:hypothetical protein